MRVLIAEDDPVVALGLERRVRSLGHEPIGPVGDGRDAVLAAQRTDPDLYLFDIGLPILDGLDAVAQLAQLGFTGPAQIYEFADGGGDIGVIASILISG